MGIGNDYDGRGDDDEDEFDKNRHKESELKRSGKQWGISVSVIRQCWLQFMAQFFSVNFKLYDCIRAGLD